MDIGGAVIMMVNVDLDLLRRRCHADQGIDSRPIGTDGLGPPVDHDLRRVDVALMQGAAIGALAGSGFGRRKRIVPADIVPVIDMERQRDHVVALRELRQVGIRRRAGRTSLRREQLDHDLFAPAGKRRGRENRAEQRTDQKFPDGSGHDRYIGAGGRKFPIKRVHLSVKGCLPTETKTARPVAGGRPICRKSAVN